MNASANITGAAGILHEPGFEYHQTLWGDLIYGTAEQMQRIGIGRDIVFPSNADGRWKRKCIDPRGFEARIQADYRGNGILSASITLPGRERHREPAIRPYTLGVTKQEYARADYFSGTAEALTAAGIVPAGHFPGYPGMRKVHVTILPDGTLPKGAPTANCAAAKEPGAKHIKQMSKGQRATYQVCVVVSHDDQERRCEDEGAREQEWEMRMRALPRPAPLVDLPGQSGKATRTHRAEGNVIYLFGCAA